MVFQIIKWSIAGDTTFAVGAFVPHRAKPVRKNARRAYPFRIAVVCELDCEAWEVGQLLGGN